MNGRRLNPRERRALIALLATALTREQLDRTAGVSNGPDLIRNFRIGLRIEAPCRREEVIDRDGRPLNRGVYRLTAEDKTSVRAALRALHLTDGSR